MISAIFWKFHGRISTWKYQHRVFIIFHDKALHCRIHDSLYFSTTSQQDRNSPNHAEARGQVALCHLSRSAARDSLRKNSNQLDYLFCIFDFLGTMIGALLSNFKQQNWLLLLEGLVWISPSTFTCQWNTPTHTNA